MTIKIRNETKINQNSPFSGLPKYTQTIIFGMKIHRPSANPASRFKPFFLVMATDGFWDVVSNEEAKRFLTETTASAAPSVGTLAEKLVLEARCLTYRKLQIFVTHNVYILAIFYRYFLGQVFLQSF
jgi:hypothetical protein